MIMKLIKFFAIPLTIAMCSTLLSCSNDDIKDLNTNNTSFKDASSDVLIKTSLPTDGIIKKQFDDYLSKGKQTRSINEEWDFNNMVEFSSINETIYCYMVADKKNPNKILGGCTTAEDLIATFFTFEKNGDLYTLKDDSNNPIADARLDVESGKIIFVETYINNSQTRASASEWCGFGMTAVGAIGAAFVPATFGASLGFTVCWGLVSVMMCR